MTYAAARISMLALVSAMLWNGQAYAQAPAQTDGTQAAATGVNGPVEADSDPQTIVVTGTRLQSNLKAPTPVTSLSQELLQKKAPTSAIDAIFDLPAVKNDSGPNQGQRTSSSVLVATPNLRGLGNIRTLTLVDGRRQVGLATGPFDTNRIPVTLIERIDVVTGGASAAYGSDAVAGVVNFVLNDHLDGLRASGQYGLAEAGDNKQYTLSAAYGSTWLDGRLHVMLGGDYTDSKGTGTIYSRPWGRREPGLVAQPNTRAAGVPAQVVTEGVEYSAFTPGGIITSGPLRGTAFDAAGNPYAFQYGAVVGNFMTGSTANYGQTPLGTFFLAQPYQRATGLGRATLDITPSISAFGDFSYTWTKSAGRAGVITYPNQVVSSLTILASNPYIPTATRQQMAQLGLTSITLGVLPTATNPDRYNSGYVTNNNSRTSQLNLGLKGSLFGDWKWDATWSHGISRNLGRFRNAPYAPNFAAATYVVSDASGNPVCGPVATNPNLNATTRAQVLPGCMPYNPFGTNPSAAAISYVALRTSVLERVKQDDYAGNLSGSPFSTWAGPIQVALGVEHRRDTLDHTGEGYDSTAIPFGGSTSYYGKRSVTEGYFEVGVPLLHDAGFIQSVDANGAVRRTHYTFSGSVTTWKVGGTVDMFNSLRLRVTESRDIRAPNLTELFQVGAQTSGGANVRNPFNGVSGSILARPFGNKALTPERAKTFTAGFVFQPRGLFSGFHAAVDYYRINLKGVVAQVTAQDTLNRCYAGIQFYCASVVTDNSAYGIAYVITTSYNLNVLRTKGVDFDLGYRLPQDLLGVPGRLTLGALGTYQPQLATTDALGVTVDRGGSAQGAAKWRWTFNLNYDVGNLSAFVQAKYTNSVLADPTLIGPDNPAYSTTAANSISQNRFPGATYFNIGLQYNLPAIHGVHAQIFGNIDNLFDKDPPTGAIAVLTGVGGQFFPYDLIGRAYRMGVRVRM